MIYKTEGTCSTEIHIEVDAGLIKDIKFVRGCHGNALGLVELAKGRPIGEVASLLEGLKCGARPTSCPDQLSKALRSLM